MYQYKLLFCLALSVMFGNVMLMEVEQNATEKAANILNVTVSPAEHIKITMNHESTINFTLILIDEQLTCQDLYMKLSVDGPDIELTNETTEVFFETLDPSSPENCFTIINVVGRQVELGVMTAVIRTFESNQVVWNTTYIITIVRTNTLLAFVAKMGVVVSMAISTFTYGCQMHMKSVKEFFKRPAGIIIGFVCQFGLMPVLSYALGVGLKLPSHMAYGLLAVGCSAGGGASNMYSVLLHGDLSMSVLMTLISTLTAIGITPLWLIYLGSHIIHKDYPDSTVVIPWVSLAIAVTVLTIPCIIGCLILSYISEKLARILLMIFRPIATILVLVSIAITIEECAWVTGYMNTWQIFVAAAGLPYIGFGISLVLALLLRQTWKASVTIMVETGIQNLLIAYMVIEPSLPVPYGSIAWAVPSLVLLLTFIPLLLTLFVAILKKLAAKEPEQNQQKYSPEEFVRSMEKTNPPSYDTTDTMTIDTMTIDNNTLTVTDTANIIVNTPKLKLRQV